MVATQTDCHERAEEQTSVHVNNDVHKTEIRHLLKTTLNSLAIMGIYFNIRRGCSPCQSEFRKHGCTIYSTLVFLLVSTFVIRHASHDFGTCLMEWIIRSIWDIQSLGYFVIFYAMSVKSCLPRLLDKWQTYRDTYAITPGSISRKSNVCASILWIFTSLNVVFDAYKTYDYYTTQTKTEESGRISYAVILGVLKILCDAYTFFAWTASSALVLLLCILLADEFESINKEIKHLIQDNREQFYKSIGDLRYRHWELCKVVQKVDDALAVHVGLSIFASLALSCLSLYLMIWDPIVSGNPMDAALTGIWMLFCLTKMTMDCVSGILINTAVSFVEKNDEVCSGSLHIRCYFCVVQIIHSVYRVVPTNYATFCSTIFLYSYHLYSPRVLRIPTDNKSEQSSNHVQNYWDVMYIAMASSYLSIP